MKIIEQAATVVPSLFGRENMETLVKGVSGTAVSLGSTYISLLAEVETFLRITSLLIGIAVGVITFISIYKSIRKRK